jgi:dipeptidyl aminopeptidase/acylaminoacyl peptidase
VTTAERFDRDLPDLLADLYPMSAPDYRDDLVQQFAATPQRPAWTFPERWIPVRALELGRALRPIPWRTIGIVALLLITIAGAAIFAASPRRLPPPFGPATNGNLVLAENGDIFLIDPATGARTAAVVGPTTDSEPVFSRDGTQLAFFREVGDGRGLVVADALGDQPRSLTMPTAGVSETIQWSPDGTSLLTLQDDGQSRAITIIPLDGSEATVLDLGMSAEDAVWLPPAGRRLLFRTPHPDGAELGYSLWTVGADGSDPHQVVAPHQFAWDSLYFGASPDGASIAYQWRETEAANMRIYVVQSAGGTPRPITSVESVLPVWSPDGAWIAFFSEDGQYVVRADGSSEERRLQPLRGDFAWTPDSSRLLYQAEGQPPLLLNPSDGSSEPAPWTSTSFPNWQRLASTP